MNEWESLVDNMIRAYGRTLTIIRPSYNSYDPNTLESDEVIPQTFTVLGAIVPKTPNRLEVALANSVAITKQAYLKAVDVGNGVFKVAIDDVISADGLDLRVINVSEIEVSAKIVAYICDLDA